MVLVPPPSTRFPAIGHQWSSVSSPAAISLVESFQFQASDWCGHWSHWSVLTTLSFPLVSGDHRDDGQGLPANFPQPISTSSSTIGMVADFAHPIPFHSSPLYISPDFYAFFCIVVSFYINSLSSAQFPTPICLLSLCPIFSGGKDEGKVGGPWVGNMRGGGWVRWVGGTMAGKDEGQGVAGKFAS